ncbi:TetR/AcrR family transcriptional regulator [Paenibacillus spiritus]|uniref:TetR/AcrR family transcriptional regulator n=1 Tax=Paenibacillus spiritus TaxID=2496557 RepID=A0A5J5FXA7_9BACL|nr:TetR/AcrR family transcriptional regulator [Paenibacillus spiritus]KAA8998383.1 TetR/AcrR family transcriptional regulator [Paenibacillus spiritus]
MADRTADKKTQIIKAAMELYADKGPGSTSMQDIAERCGISKGSLYLSFKSKEELEESIFLYCFRLISRPLLAADHAPGRTPREKLREQIEILLHHLYELREFLLRQVQEWVGSTRDKKPAEWMRHLQPTLIAWFGKRLSEIYGPGIAPYSGDLWLFADGMVGAYVRALFHPFSPLKVPAIADHFIRLLDMVAAGLIEGKAEPLLSASRLAELISCGEPPFRHPLQLIRRLRELAAASDSFQAGEREDIEVSLSVLEEEVRLPLPRRAVINGMLSNLTGHPALAEACGELEALLTAYLEHLNRN